MFGLSGVPLTVDVQPSISSHDVRPESQCPMFTTPSFTEILAASEGDLTVRNSDSIPDVGTIAQEQNLSDQAVPIWTSSKKEQPSM